MTILTNKARYCLIICIDICCASNIHEINKIFVNTQHLVMELALYNSLYLALPIKSRCNYVLLIKIQY